MIIKTKNLKILIYQRKQRKRRIELNLQRKSDEEWPRAELFFALWSEMYY